MIVQKFCHTMQTRKHSSRMRTARLLTRVGGGGGGAVGGGVLSGGVVLSITGSDIISPPREQND